MLYWTKHALDDLENILRYIANYDENSSQRVAKALYETIKHVEEFPQIGTQGRKLNTRELFLSKYPYVFIYRQKNTRIEILRLLHTHQQRP